MRDEARYGGYLSSRPENSERDESYHAPRASSLIASELVGGEEVLDDGSRLFGSLQQQQVPRTLDHMQA